MTRPPPPPPAHQAAPQLPASSWVYPTGLSQLPPDGSQTTPASTSGLQTNPVLSMLQQRIRHDTELLNRIMSQQNQNDISGMSSPHFQEDLHRWMSPHSQAQEDLSRFLSPHSREDHSRWMSPYSQEDHGRLMSPHSQENHGRLMSPHSQAQEDLSSRLTSPYSQ